MPTHRLRNALAGISLMLMLGVAGAAEAQVTESEVRFNSAYEDAIPMAGTLLLPEGEGPFPAVLILSGSGPQDRDGRDPSLGEHRIYRDIAQQLSEEGYAVLRFDDRGAGETPGNPAGATVDHLGGDAIGAFRFLATSEDIDPDRIAILGHSEGGAIAFVAAEQTRPAAIVSLAGPAVDFREVFSGQYRAQQIAANDSAEAIAANQRFLSIIYSEMDLHEGAPQSVARPALAAVFEELGLPPEAGLDMLTSDYLRSWYAHDVRASIRQYDGPVLALYGEYDLSVHPATNAAAMGGRIDPRNGSLVRIVQGHNHLFQIVDSPLADPAAQDMAIDPAIVTEIAEWLHDTIGE